MKRTHHNQLISLRITQEGKIESTFQTLKYQESLSFIKYHELSIAHLEQLHLEVSKENHAFLWTQAQSKITNQLTFDIEHLPRWHTKTFPSWNN